MNNQLDLKNIPKLEFLSGNNFHLISRKSIVEAWKPRSSSSRLLSNPFQNIQRARSFIPWARLSRRIRASGTEKVFLVKQSTELKRGTMKAGNQKQWAIVDRRSPLSSRFAFSVPSFLLLPSTSYNSLVFIPPWNEQRSNELPYA